MRQTARCAFRSPWKGCDSFAEVLEGRNEARASFLKEIEAENFQ